MSAKPKLIVTGLSGLLGTCLKKLASSKYDLIDISLPGSVDITDRPAMLEFIASHGDAAALIHLAAFTDVSAAWKQRGQKDAACYRINVLGTRNVAEACKASGLHLLHVSTDFVFDGRKAEPYNEQDDPNPIEWYGRTKLLGEEEARSAEAWTMIRIAYPYVAGPAARPDHIGILRGALQDRRPLKRFDDQYVTPTCADDVARGLLLLVETRPPGALFHLVGSGSLTPYDLALKVADAFGLDRELIRPSSVKDYNRSPGVRPYQENLRISNAKWSEFARRHGLDPPLTIDEGLEKVRAAVKAAR